MDSGSIINYVREVGDDQIIGIQTKVINQATTPTTTPTLEEGVFTPC